MIPTAHDEKVRAIPEKPQMHHSFDESVDESAGLIENEPVEIDAEVAAEQNEPVDENEQDQADSAFEEE
jgi:hypothetical protein